MPARRALVIDDEHSVRALMSSALQWQFDDVAVCANGDEALAATRAGEFDVLLVDLRLGEGPVDGLLVLERLRAAGCVAPAIIMTGGPAAMDADRAGILGVTALLEKPFDLDTLERVILAASPRAAEPTH